MADINNERTIFTCFKCFETGFNGYSSLTKHFRFVHGFSRTTGKSDFALICAQNGCKQAIHTWANYRYHISVCRGTNVDQQNASYNSQPSENELVLDDSAIAMEIDDAPCSSVAELETKKELFQQSIEESVGLLTLGMRADYLATHSLIDYVADGVQQIGKRISKAVKEGITDVDAAIGSLDRLNTQKKRKTFYKKHFGLFSVEELVLGHCFKSGGIDGTGNTLPPVQVSQSGYYIPIASYLQALFSNSNFSRLYFNAEPSSDDFIRCYRDTQHFKKHPLFSSCRSALQLQLFYDEVEVVNPLGSKTKKHELAMFYFRILNLPHQLNSVLSHYFTFAVIPSKMLSHETFDIINQRLLLEIAQLESPTGMHLFIKNRDDFYLRGTIVSYCADTKGAHQLFGFMGPSANYFCRLCLVQRSEILSLRNHSSLNMRNRVNYNDALKANSMNNTSVNNTGVVHECKLNQSKYFHCTENKVMDAMHDFLEGVCPFIIMLCLREWVTNHWETDGPKISADLLNGRIQCFEYGLYDLSNKPSPKFTDYSIRQPGNYSTKQRAVQNWCLIRNLPFLIEDLIPLGNIQYELLLQLLDIMEIVFAPRYLIEHTVFLDGLIELFFENFATAFPDMEKVINKVHHMHHYGDLLRECGPGRQNWTARFEAKHQEAKRIARENFNFKNISLSVAEHQAEVFCNQMQKSDAFASEYFEHAPVKVASFLSLNTQGATHANIDTQGLVGITNYVKINGWTYRAGSIIVLKFSHETKSENPKFAKIKIVFLQQEKIFALASVLKRSQNRRLRAYSVETKTPEKLIIIELKDFAENEPLWAVKSFDNSGVKYVCARNIL